MTATLGFVNRASLPFRLALVSASLVCASTLSGQTVVLDKQLTVKPIYIQNGSGGPIAVLDNYAAQIPLYQEATQALLAQAGIRVKWETQSIFVDLLNEYFTITGDLSQLGNLTNTGGHGQSVNSQFPTPNVGSTLNLWFSGPQTGGILGFSQQSFNVPRGFIFPDPIFNNGATVSESVFSAGGNRSLNVIAHELGHVLGLPHDAIIAGPTYYSSSPTLLTAGTRNMMADAYLGATTLDQITRDGITGHGILTANQIELLRLSRFIVNNTTLGDTYTYAIPEPSTVALFAGVGVLLVAIWRRKLGTSR